jgi:hypothetical protein
MTQSVTGGVPTQSVRNDRHSILWISSFAAIAHAHGFLLIERSIKKK